MTTTRLPYRALRLGAAMSLVLVAAGCVSAPDPSATREPTTAKADDQASRMLRYCQQLHDQGDHYVATGVCKKAFELDQTNPEPLHRLAAIMTDAGSLDRAAEAYFLALHLNPNDVEARYGLSKAYMAIGRHDLAIPHLQAALEQEDEDHRLHNAMGVSFDQQGRHAEAQKHYNMGLELAPTNPSLHNNLNLSLALSNGPAAGFNGNNQLTAAPVAEPTDDPLAGAAVEQSAVVELATTPPPEPATAAPVVAEPVTTEPAVTETLEIETAVPETLETETAVPETLETETAVTETVVTEPVMERPVETQVVEAPARTPQFDAPEAAEPGPNEIEAAVIDEPVTESEVGEAPLVEPVSEQSEFDRSEMVQVPEPSQPIGQASSTLEPAPTETSSELDQSAAARISDALPWVSEPSSPPAPETAPEPEAQQLAAVPPVAEDPAEPATAPVEVASDGPVFMVQVGSYLERPQALEGWQVITESAPDLLAGFEPRVMRADAGGETGIVYRLRTGPLADYAAGNALCAALSERGLGCFVVQMTAEELAASGDDATMEQRSGYDDQG